MVSPIVKIPFRKAIPLYRYPPAEHTQNEGENRRFHHLYAYSYPSAFPGLSSVMRPIFPPRNSSSTITAARSVCTSPPDISIPRLRPDDLEQLPAIRRHFSGKTVALRQKQRVSGGQNRQQAASQLFTVQNLIPDGARYRPDDGRSPDPRTSARAHPGYPKAEPRPEKRTTGFPW